MINFRLVPSSARAKMRNHNEDAFRKLEAAEISKSGSVWIRREDFPRCLDRVPDEKPSKHGTMFRF